MIIGLEGVSCTGKSTLARGLAPCLGCAAIIPCYYHAAPDPALLPSPKVTSEAEQIEALRVHLRIEETRHRGVQAALRRGELVLLDRTVDTLLAHIRAVGEMNHLNANQRARTLVTRQISLGQAAMPDVTLLLTSDSVTLAARASARPGLHSLYYDPDFARGFDAHFRDNPVTPACHPLDTAGPRAAVLEHALRLLRPYLGGCQ
jgi:thymidylate kinase